jgi:hypothetical protein
MYGVLLQIVLSARDQWDLRWFHRANFLAGFIKRFASHAQKSNEKPLTPFLVCCSFRAPRLERWRRSRANCHFQCRKRGWTSHTATSTEHLCLFAAAVHRPPSIPAAIRPSSPFPASTSFGASTVLLSDVPASPNPAFSLTGEKAHQLSMRCRREHTLCYKVV